LEEGNCNDRTTVRKNDGVAEEKLGKKTLSHWPEKGKSGGVCHLRPHNFLNTSGGGVQIREEDRNQAGE